MKPERKKDIIFVAGIGTDVGKTVVSAILCEAFQADYWKPVQAGTEEGGDIKTIEQLISNKSTKIHPSAVVLPYPISPHASAEKAGIEINSIDLKIPDTENNLIIEGAGGLMVPLNYNELFIDWVKLNNLKVVLVSRHYLGSINHTLLSAESLKTRNIEVTGIIFNGAENKATEKVIELNTGFTVLGRIDELKEVSANSIHEQAEKFKLNGNF
ncbi:MAG: dethiobiotin synthase [Bacteroidia bacterium]